MVKLYFVSFFTQGLLKDLIDLGLVPFRGDTKYADWFPGSECPNCI